ncbi:DUF5610 domain-containing protein [Shewanella glacialimarina]|jgi:hypothetical protein|uniref:DUF5610 domain-containing protein n=1 Tax=Shewanella glacialimarina TaxID=2590884 RepID=UPI001CF83676|nr:DUF5610 domain-containing protein [Shewanella glacialimarina]UCX05789.1 hypothetical protein FJ709_15645 [Shewanella glacialimarina]
MEIKPNRNMTQFTSLSKNTEKDKQAVDNVSNQGVQSADKQANMSVSQITKRLMNGQILAAQEKVTLSSGDQSLALLYRSAIDAIDAELDLVLGENKPSKSMEVEVDYSPTATADRIVQFATGFFGLYQQQNPDGDFETQLNSFMDKISKAIDDGFGQAKAILSGLKVLQGDIVAGVDSTYEHIQSGLAKFKLDMLPSTKDAKE